MGWTLQADFSFKFTLSNTQKGLFSSDIHLHHHHQKKTNSAMKVQTKIIQQSVSSTMIFSPLVQAIFYCIELLNLIQVFHSIENDHFISLQHWTMDIQIVFICLV